mmetsp:Transcript_33392/g.50349  ORF Transcript_33392/g.50349 Transcript_33392/m.50349 type:complete len:411 (-) Transcript_33392:31-1263(-)
MMCAASSKRRPPLLIITFILSFLILQTKTIVVVTAISSSSSTGLYSTLGLSKDCTDKDIKKAYRKLALKHHPDKVPSKDRDKAEKKFKQIARAYEILSDDEKRKLYDQYGERSLDSNFNPMFAGAGGGGGAGFSGFGAGPNGFGGSGAGSQSFQYFPNQYGGGGGSSPFSDMFSGKGNPGSAGGGGVGGGMPIDLSDLLASMMGGKGSPTSMPGGAGSTRGFADFFNAGSTPPPPQQQQQQRPPPTEGYTRPFHCTLEELATGRTKKLKVTIPVFDDETGQTIPQNKIYTVDVKPGWKSGTKIKFKAKAGFPPITFVLKVKPHPYLTRDVDNLVWNCRLTERQAKKGAKLKVPLPNGENLEISTQDRAPCRDGDTMTIHGKGMPLKGGDVHNRGDLIIKFRVVSNINSKQ